MLYIPSDFKLDDIIGLKIVGIYESSGSYEEYAVILFDDGETYMTLSEQDQYTYHDCNTDAREIGINKDKEYHEKILKLIQDSNSK